MTKLILLAVTLLASLTTFSQNDIKTITKDSCIILPKNVAIQVAKDLVKKDSLEAELNVCKDNQNLYISNLHYKDSIINGKVQEVALCKQEQINLNTTIALKDEQNQKLTLLVKDLNRQIKGYKIKSALKKGGNYIIYGGLIYTIIRLVK